MFKRELTIGRNRLIVTLSDNPASERNDHYFFGFPLHPDLNNIDNSSIQESVNSIKGYFLYIGIEPERIIIANDITGGYRLYLHKSGTTIYLSDDFENIISVMPETGGIKFDDNELHYWRKHGYTTGGASLFHGLHKLEPASILEMSPKGLSRHIYFSDIENTPDAGSHSKHCLDDLKETVSTLAASGDEIVLFISGGVDSSLLALSLKEIRKDLRLCFARSRPYYRDNYESHIRARTLSEYLGLPLEEIEIDMEKGLQQIGDITHRMLFDRHPSVLHFGALREIRKRYGQDVIIINGQGADSVLCYGPSGAGKGDFAARSLINRPFGLMAKLAGRMVCRTHGRKYRIPTTDHSYLLAFFDQFQYYTVLSDDDPGNYCKYLDGIITRLMGNFKSREALLMYLKIYSFLQGSDNQVVIQSARAAEIRKVIMPYVSPRFIYHTVHRKDSRRDLYHPKYVIRNGIGSFGKKLPEPEILSGNDKLLSMERFSDKIDAALWDTAKRYAKIKSDMTACERSG